MGGFFFQKGKEKKKKKKKKKKNFGWIASALLCSRMELICNVRI